MNSFFKNKLEEFLFIATLLFAFIAFYIETDIYTPSFPQMKSFFHTNEETIELLLSMNFFGLCTSCLFFGPASDAYGRKLILCIGLFIFLFGSIGCAFTNSLNWMIFFRFFQGIGCGAIVSSGCTLFFDAFPPDRSSRLVSTCNGIVGGMMALAPMIGNWISIQYDWRVNFYIIALLAIISFFSVLIFIKEPLSPDKRINFNPVCIFKNYCALLKNFPFMSHTLIWCIGFSIVIVFIANLSLIFIGHLSVSKALFGFYQAAIMGVYFIGSIGGSFVNKKMGMKSTKIIGSVIYLTGILMLGFLTFSKISFPMLFIIAMSIASFGSALAMPIYFTYSITYLNDSLKGSAMSLSQSIRLLLSSGLVWIAAIFFDGSTKPISFLSIASTVLCVLLYVILYMKKQHLSKVETNLSNSL